MQGVSYLLIFQVWRIAENWEVEPAHLLAAEAVQAGRIGSIRTFCIKSVLYVDDEGNKYFETAWRRKPQVRITGTALGE